MVTVRALVLFTAVLILSVIPPLTSGQTEGGSAAMATYGAHGNNYFTLQYHYSENVKTGSDLVMALTLFVNNITGQESYIINYELVVTVYVDLTHVVEASVGSTTGLGNTSGRPLYPGSHWGPLNVTLPISESNSGVSAGQSRNASIGVALNYEVWLELPYNYDLTEGTQASAGSVIVQGPSSTTVNYLGYALVVGGIAVVAAALILLRDNRDDDSMANEKPSPNP